MSLLDARYPLVLLVILAACAKPVGPERPHAVPDAYVPLKEQYAGFSVVFGKGRGEVCIASLERAGAMTQPEHAAWSRAVAALRKADGSTALAALKDAGSHPALQAARAAAMLWTGGKDLATAASIQDGLLHRWPHDPCLIETRALIAFHPDDPEDGDPFTASALAARAAEAARDPTAYANAVLIEAQVARSQEHPDLAEKDLDLLLERQPDQAAGHLLRMWTFVDRNDVAGALPDLEWLADSGAETRLGIRPPNAFERELVSAWLQVERPGEVIRRFARAGRLPLTGADALAKADDPMAALRTRLGVREGEDLVAVVHTSRGDLTCHLFLDKAPLAVADFVELARGAVPWTDAAGRTHTTPYYDGTRVGRAEGEEVLLDTKSGVVRKRWGPPSPGFLFPIEVTPLLASGLPLGTSRSALPDVDFDTPGLLGMRGYDGADTSQLFVTLGHGGGSGSADTRFGQCDPASVKLADQIAHDPSNAPPVVVRSIEIRSAPHTIRPIDEKLTNATYGAGPGGQYYPSPRPNTPRAGDVHLVCSSDVEDRPEMCVAGLAKAGPLSAAEQAAREKALAALENRHPATAITALADAGDHPALKALRAVALDQSDSADALSSAEGIQKAVMKRWPHDPCLLEAGAEIAWDEAHQYAHDHNVPLASPKNAMLPVALDRAARAEHASPDDRGAWWLHALIALDAGERTIAVTDLGQLLAKHPDDKQAHAKRAQIWLDAHQLDEAIPDLEWLVAHQGGPANLSLLVQAWLTQGRPDEVVRLFAKRGWQPLTGAKGIATAADPMAAYRKSLGYTRDEDLVAVLHTGRGDLTCTLFPDKAPLAVATFVGFSRGTLPWRVTDAGPPITKPMYAGSHFDKVGTGWIHGGIPTAPSVTDFPGPVFWYPREVAPVWADAAAGSVKGHVAPELTFDRPGRLAMDGQTGDDHSEFFVTSTAQPKWSAAKNPIFGQCDAASVKVVDAIAGAPTKDRYGKPVDPVVIRSIEIHAEKR